MKASKYNEKQEFGIVESIPAPVRITSTDTELTVVVYDFLEKAALKAFTAAGITDASGNPDVGHPVPPKYAKLFENIEKYFKSDPKGKQIVFTDEKSQHNKLARILERNVNGLEPGRIGIINAEEASGTDLDRISKAFNSGEYLLVIANKKAEVGVNLQKGTVAIHHLTLPWTPASINQRNGRGVRQGNKVANVDVYYYCGKRTFDEYRAETLKGKANWIQQILNSDALEAENADFASDDEMAVMLAENPEEQRRIIAEQKAKRATEEEQRKNKLYGTFVGQYLTAKKAFDRYDEITAATIEKRKTDIAKAEKGGNKERVALLQEQLEIYKKGRENGKPKAEADVTRAKKQLTNLEASGEKLPFNFAEIEGKEDKCTVIPATGLVLMDGDYVRARKKISYSINADAIYQVKFEDYLFKRNELKLISVISNNSNTLNISEGALLYKVSPSKDELETLRLTNRTVWYSDIYESGISKEAFFAIRDSIRVTRGEHSVYEKPDGTLIVSIGSDSSTDWVLSYPEPENKQWKEAVLQSLSKILKIRNGGVDYNKVFFTLFNVDSAGLANLIQKYRTEVPEDELLRIMKKSIKDTVDILCYEYWDKNPNKKPGVKESALGKWLELLYAKDEINRDFTYYEPLIKRLNDYIKDAGYTTEINSENALFTQTLHFAVIELEERINKFNKEWEEERKLEKFAENNDLDADQGASASDTNNTNADDSPEVKAFMEKVFEATKRRYIANAQYSGNYSSTKEILKGAPKWKSTFRTSFSHILKETAEAERPAGWEESLYFKTLWNNFMKEVDDIINEPLDPLLDQEVVDNFAKIGIEMTVNKTAFATKYRGRKTDYPERGYYMLFDKKGYNGKLKSKKDTLKSKFDAKYTKEYPPEMDKSFWLIPVEKAKPADIWRYFA